MSSSLTRGGGRGVLCWKALPPVRRKRIPRSLFPRFPGRRDGSHTRLHWAEGPGKRPGQAADESSVSWAASLVFDIPCSRARPQHLEGLLISSVPGRRDVSPPSPLGRGGPGTKPRFPGRLCGSYPQPPLGRGAQAQDLDRPPTNGGFLGGFIGFNPVSFGRGVQAYGLDRPPAKPRFPGRLYGSHTRLLWAGRGAGRKADRPPINGGLVGFTHVSFA